MSVLEQSVIQKLKDQFAYDSFTELVEELSSGEISDEERGVKINSFIHSLNSYSGSLRAPMSLKDVCSFPQLLKEVDSHLKKYGGHNLAAGFTLSADSHDEFTSMFKRVVAQKQFVYNPKRNDVIDLSLSDITEQNIKKIMSLSPFGIDFPVPVLKVSISDVDAIAFTILPHKKDATKCHLRIPFSISCMIFNIPIEEVKSFIENQYLKEGVTLELYLKPSQNPFRGNTSYQVIAESYTFIPSK